MWETGENTMIFLENSQFEPIKKERFLPEKGEKMGRKMTVGEKNGEKKREDFVPLAMPLTNHF